MTDEKETKEQVQIALGIQQFDPKTMAINAEQPPPAKLESAPPPKPKR